MPPEPPFQKSPSISYVRALVFWDFEGASVATCQGTKIDAAVSKSATLKKQVAWNLGIWRNLTQKESALTVADGKTQWIYVVDDVDGCYFLMTLRQCHSYWKPRILKYMNICILFTLKSPNLYFLKRAPIPNWSFKGLRNFLSSSQQKFPSFLVASGHNQGRVGWFGRDSGAELVRSHGWQRVHWIQCPSMSFFSTKRKAQV